MKNDESILIISKYPYYGNSKTRLGKYIGYGKSSNIAKCLLDDTLDICKKYTNNVFICCPERDEHLFEDNYPDINLLSSSNNSGCSHDSIIGLETLFNETSSSKTIIISPDTPSFDDSSFNRVFKELDNNRYVVGFNRDKKPYAFGANKRFVNSKQKQILKILPDYAISALFYPAYYLFKRPFFQIYREKESIDIDTCKDLADISKQINARNYKRTSTIISEYVKSNEFNFDLCSGIAKECSLFSSNMPVSALAVKDNKIVSSGHRFETGFGKHAEHCMIEKAENNLRDSTVFVTLEPCTNRVLNLMKGCTHKLAESGVKKVIFGNYDMNPKTKGVEELEQLGIECFHSPVFESRINHHILF